MTELRLISGGAALAEPAEAEAVPVLRLPPGRHGIPADLVRAHQRLRLLEAAAAAVAEQGYGRVTAARVTELAGVSSRTFYQHFEDLWACLLAAYETEVEPAAARRSRRPARRWSRSAARSPKRTAAAGPGRASPRQSTSSPPRPTSPACSAPSPRRRSPRSAAPAAT